MDLGMNTNMTTSVVVVALLDQQEASQAIRYSCTK